MLNFDQNLATLQQRIKEAVSLCDRDHSEIQILAVSKNHSIEKIEFAYLAGLRNFGESYVQEALPKIKALQSHQDIQWHFIGPIQSNKTRAIAENFHWVHSVDRIKIASRLNEQRPENMPPLNICIQLNINHEQTKSGLLKEAVLDFASQLASLSNLKLRGLMAIPQKTTDETEQRQAFSGVRRLFDDMNQQGYALDTLSMGMSGDLESAIVEGATIIRIGTALFGPR